MNQGLLYAVVETADIDDPTSWTWKVAKALPLLAGYINFSCLQDMLELGETFDGVVFVGSTALTDAGPVDLESTLVCLQKLKVAGFASVVVFLTDRDPTDKIFTDAFQRTFPGVKIMSKAAVADGTLQIPDRP